MLYLPESCRAAIAAHAEGDYPWECCGLLLGTVQSNGDRHVIEACPTPNAWDALRESFPTPEIPAASGMAATVPPGDHPVPRDETRQFAIDPADFLRLTRVARDRNLDIIGIYHSHPDHPAVPSEFDRTYAWPQYSYVIVAIESGHLVDCQSWRLDADAQFQQEPIVIPATDT
jgi:proteasome lid subunit RPN8/RPN11